MFQQLRCKLVSDEILHACWERPTSWYRYDSSAPGVASDFNTLRPAAIYNLKSTVPGHFTTLWKSRSIYTPSGLVAWEVAEYIYSARTESVNTLVTSNIIQSVALWATVGWRKGADQNCELTYPFKKSPKTECRLVYCRHCKRKWWSPYTQHEDMRGAQVSLLSFRIIPSEVCYCVMW
jgi:hypothetical protein